MEDHKMKNVRFSRLDEATGKYEDVELTTTHLGTNDTADWSDTVHTGLNRKARRRLEAQMRKKNR